MAKSARCGGVNRGAAAAARVAIIRRAPTERARHCFKGLKGVVFAAAAAATKGV